VRAAHQVDRHGVAEPRRVEVERGDEAEATAGNEADPDAGREAGVSEVEPAAGGEPQQGRLETGCIPDRKELLGFVPGPPLPPISVGTSRSTSSRPSLVCAWPSRPPTAVASAV
jgi:hypothetical protein